MPPNVKFILLSAFAILIPLLTSADNPCVPTGDGLNCAVGNGSSLTSTFAISSNSVNQILIVYNGSVSLQISAPSTKFIIIEPASDSDEHSLQITSISTNVASMALRVRLSANQAARTLFPDSTAFNALNSTLSVYVVQTAVDPNSLKVFDGTSATKVSLVNYEVVFNFSGSNAGTLNLPNLLAGLTVTSGVIISGSNHYLSMNGTNSSSFPAIEQLKLKNLRLQEPVMSYFAGLNIYQVEGCTFDNSSAFLKPINLLNQSLIMKNNNPLDSTLPGGDSAFTGLSNYISMTFIEPKLNSSVLRALGSISRLNTLTLDLGAYDVSDFTRYRDQNRVLGQLVINSIADLSVLPDLFFNKLNTLQKTTLRGTFELKKQAICLFYGMANPNYATYPILNVESPARTGTNSSWSQCAQIYIDAINIKTISNVFCYPDNSWNACYRWAVNAALCNFSAYETNQCPALLFTNGPLFSYQNSSLYAFFQNYPWGSSTGGTSAAQDSLNIGAIVGALCALLLAITVLIVVVFCIRRCRQKEARKYLSSAPGHKDEPPPYDFSHLSIATSKTSYSTKRDLSQSIFPPLQPNDEIAPPLYTAPSESTAPHSSFKAPSAPPRRRDSITTQGTHVYETLEP